MPSGLIVSAFLVGLAGVPHCLTMCSAPCFGVAKRCAKPGGVVGHSLIALHLGRLTGYTVAGGLVAASLAVVGTLTNHVSALRPLWVLAQIAMVVLGAWLAATGRLPEAWSARGLSVDIPPERLTQAPNAHGVGLLQAYALGVSWAFLPCAQLYSGLLLCSMASTPAEGALTAVAFTIPGTAALLAGPTLLPKMVAALGGLVGKRKNLERVIQVSRDGRLIEPAAPQSMRTDLAITRLTGVALMVSSSWMLGHSTQSGWRYLCGV